MGFDLRKKDFIWIGFIVVVVGLSFGYAFGGTNPAIEGHSVKEIDFSGGFSVPSGNVGIGVPVPTQKLDVNGNIKASDFYIAKTGQWASELSSQINSLKNQVNSLAIKVGSGSAEITPKTASCSFGSYYTSSGWKHAILYGKIDSQGHTYVRVVYYYTPFSIIIASAHKKDTGWMIAMPYAQHTSLGVGSFTDSYLQTQYSGFIINFGVTSGGIKVYRPKFGYADGDEPMTVGAIGCTANWH